jgi:hypothetical protein
MVEVCLLYYVRGPPSTVNLIAWLANAEGSVLALPSPLEAAMPNGQARDWRSRVAGSTPVAAFKTLTSRIA